MSGSSSGGKRTQGADWTSRVRYLSQSDKRCSPKEAFHITEGWTTSCRRDWTDKYLLEKKDKGYAFTIDDPTLEYAMNLLIDCSEEILEIWVFKSPLYGWQLSQLWLNHQFVVIRTANWWWSIEKNAKEILIQRSKYFSLGRGVRDYENNEKRRTPLRRVSSDKGQKTMKELIAFLYKNDELNKKYILEIRNCKHFAKGVFDAFAKNKLHDTKWGCDPSGKDIKMEVDSKVWDSKWLKKSQGS